MVQIYNLLKAMIYFLFSKILLEKIQQFLSWKHMINKTMRRVRDIEEEHQDIDIKKAPIKNTVQPKILKLSIYTSVETSKKKNK